MDLNIAAAAGGGTSTTSLWSLLYQQSQKAFGQFFSMLNADWLKGRPCTHGCLAVTKNGPVRGKTFLLTEQGHAETAGVGPVRRVNAFLGIPYARAGTHQDRFKKPFPVEPWQEPLECSNFGPRAIQYDMFWDTYITPIRQDEAHCLHIGVFAPDWEFVPSQNGTGRGGGGGGGRPVVVFVHGGGFLIHSAANYGDWNICQNLCLHDVVVCVVQYRLGLLGFLSSGDSRCPGNFGLWDQLAAFQWVKENISAFGGDPENVTAFGQSAGAASIDLLSLSPLTKGLFNRVILMGGNASTDWAIVKPERTQAAAIRVAKRNGWRGGPNDLDSLLAFLRAMPAHKLTAPLIGKSAFNRHRKGLEFCPVIDGELLTAPVEELRRRRRSMDSGQQNPMEVLIGGTEFEALLFVALGRSQSDLMSLRKYLQIYIPDETAEAVAKRKRFEQFYLKGVDTENPKEMSIAFLRLHSDLMMNNSVQRYCHAMLGPPNAPNNGHKIYLYNMSHFNADEFGFIGLRMPFYAATHCHDLRYLLGKGLYSKFRPNWDDKHLMRIMGQLFTNFAKFGSPNGMQTGQKEDEQSADSILPQWLPITPEDPYRHMELCLEPKMRPNYQGRRFEFWKREEEEEMQQMAKQNGAK